ncbi:hypothetical protein [Sapientia aquatica]|uniref:Uncharacterized protein n=1 Tax=Sapientia aquatica TaxID=1549640 RepID=A0A4R5W1F7_9BURK|nr:hypothetical protein [Sapientia aquatica]TDK65996.1 hypothetical protein E2I14_10410 [Sapientia aquatica]
MSPTLTKLISLSALAALAACNKPTVPVMDNVIAKLTQTDVSVTNIQTPPRNGKGPMPSTFKEQITFSVTETAPKGGQVFTCAERAHCDALFAYFNSLKGIAGPYLYQSKSGLLVAQFNSGLAPATADKLHNAITEF